MINFSLIPVLFGIGIGIYFALDFEPSLWVGVICVETLIIMAIIWRYYPYRLMILGLVGVVVLGFCNVQLQSHYLSKHKTINVEKTLYLKGQVGYKDYNSRGNPRYVLENVVDFDNRPLLNKTRISINKSHFVVGQCVEVVARIMPPYKQPFYGSYDFSKKAYFDGLQANGYAITQANIIECENKKSSFVSNIRENIVNKINDNIKQKDEASVAAALIAGEKGKVSQKILTQYRDSGLAHVLSISGMHMSMIAGLMFLFARTMLAFIPKIALKYDIKKISAAVAMMVATFYLLISGAMVPTQRAFIMVFIVLLGVLFERKAVSVKNISIAALIILIISPEVLTSPSFQMSFAAVLCLIAFYERFAASINRFIKKFGFIISYVLGLLIADLVASIATLPFAIYHFNKIALYTTLANMLAGPIIGLLVMPAMLISLVMMPLGLEALPLHIVGYGIGLMNDISQYVSNLDGATLHVLSMPTWAFVIIVFGGLLLCLRQDKFRLYGLLPIAIGFLSLLFVNKPDAVYINKPSRFEKMLVEQKYGNIKIEDKKPYGAVVYNNKIKEIKNNRIWNTTIDKK